MLDDERCFRAVQSRDPRFDGWFVTAVRTTGIYCRPSCPAMTPKRSNVGFFPSAAAAQSGGFRACKRCRPDATPGSPEWDARADVVARAMRLVADGAVDREGVRGLARRLGYSERHLHRLLLAEVGAGPQALARAQRAQTARLLLETTDVPVTQVAFAAGFASIRQFNDTVREVFALTPSALRAGARRGGTAGEPAAAGTVALRLPFREPFDARRIFRFLAVRAVPGVETGDDEHFRRTLTLPRGSGVVALHRADGHVRCDLRLDDLRDLNAAVQRSRRLLDLDADPEAVDALLGDDPVLADLVRARPGLRSPGHVDAVELAVRAVLGQQVSVTAARTLAGRLVLAHGAPVAGPAGPLTHHFPTAAALREADPATFGMPRRRAATLVALAAALDDGLAIDAGADRDEVRSSLLALPGIGPWTADYIRLRGMGDPDVFLGGDLGVRRALERLGHTTDAAGADELARRWRPWRSYALHHLWASLDPKEIDR